MSDTQAAMREFRFLEEKRSRGELSEAEAQRWHELRQVLGFPPLENSYDPAAYAQQQYGYYASDGNWYPYPTDEYGRQYDPYAQQGYAYPEGYPQQTDPYGQQPGYDPNAYGWAPNGAESGTAPAQMPGDEALDPSLDLMFPSEPTQPAPHAAYAAYDLEPLVPPSPEPAPEPVALEPLVPPTPEPAAPEPVALEPLVSPTPEPAPEPVAFEPLVPPTPEPAPEPVAFEPLVSPTPEPAPEPVAFEPLVPPTPEPAPEPVAFEPLVSPTPEPAPEPARFALEPLVPPSSEPAALEAVGLTAGTSPSAVLEEVEVLELGEADVAPAEPESDVEVTELDESELTLVEPEAAAPALSLSSAPAEPATWGAVPEPEPPVMDLAEADLTVEFSAQPAPSLAAATPPVEPPPPPPPASVILSPELEAELSTPVDGSSPPLETTAESVPANTFDVDMSEGSPETFDGAADDAVPLASAAEFIPLVASASLIPAPQPEPVPPAPPPPETPARHPAPTRPPRAATSSSRAPTPLELETQLGTDHALFGAPGSFSDGDEEAQVDWSEPAADAPAAQAFAELDSRFTPLESPAVHPTPPSEEDSGEMLEEIELIDEVTDPGRAMGSTAFIQGEHRVIIHTMEGQVKRGVLRDVDLLDNSIPLELQMGAAPERIPTERLKAIFFMQAAGARPPATQGRKIRVTFKDGRQVAGFSDDFQNAEAGFFVVPADQRTNTARIYIFRASVQGVAEG